MALTKTVTRAFPDANHVGLHLLFKDDTETIIDHDYMEQWDGTPKMSDAVVDEITKRMQVDIDAYKKLKIRSDDTGDDAAVVSVGTALKLE